MCVIIAAVDEMVESLKEGEIVELGELGRFQVLLSSKGAHTVEDFNNSFILRSRLNFRPGPLLREALGVMTYTRVPPKPKDEPEEDKTGKVEP